MKKQLINQMLQIARKKLSKHHELMNFPHYSFIVSSAKIIEWAENANLEPQKHFGYHGVNKSKSFRPKYHAELFAFHRAKGLLRNNEKFDVVNFRFNKQGHLKLSKPCDVCFKLLSLFGAKKFYYSSGVEEELLELKGMSNVR